MYINFISPQTAHNQYKNVHGSSNWKAYKQSEYKTLHSIKNQSKIIYNKLIMGYICRSNVFIAIHVHTAWPKKLEPFLVHLNFTKY